MKNRFQIVLLSLLLWHCTKHVAPTTESMATPYNLKVPKGFPAPVIPSFNPLTVEGIALGRNLYFDPILSSNGLSCSSCHNPKNSFSSPFFTTKTGIRISIPAHINLAFGKIYFWDGTAPNLDEIGLADFGPDFFNTNMPDLVLKLKSHPEYPAMFQKAFGVYDVSILSYKDLQLKIVYAISQFMRTMISSNSRFDKWIRHEGSLTEEEIAGYEIFFTEKGDCFHCHGYPLMTSNSFHNTGLDAIPTGQDQGYFLATGNQTDKGKFRSPTLRNIELTAPYMHDGRYQTLEQVIDFYDSGVHQLSPNIDPIMTKPFKEYGLSLSPIQKNNLLKFLKTLTDTAFINNSAFRKQ